MKFEFPNSDESDSSFDEPQNPQNKSRIKSHIPAIEAVELLEHSVCVAEERKSLRPKALLKEEGKNNKLKKVSRKKMVQKFASKHQIRRSLEPKDI